MEKEEKIEVKLWVPKLVDDFWKGNEWYLGDYQTLFLDVLHSRIQEAAPNLLNVLGKRLDQTISRL